MKARDGCSSRHQLFVKLLTANTRHIFAQRTKFIILKRTKTKKKILKLEFSLNRLNQVERTEKSLVFDVCLRQFNLDIHHKLVANVPFTNQSFRSWLYLLYVLMLTTNEDLPPPFPPKKCRWKKIIRLSKDATGLKKKGQKFIFPTNRIMYMYQM